MNTADANPASATDRTQDAVRLAASAILFDMDGVLVDSRTIVERTWRRWALAHGYDADAILRIAHGRRSTDTLRTLSPDIDIVTEVRALDDAEQQDFDGLVAIPGARQLLDTLPPTAWAVVTSASRQLAVRRLTHAELPLPAVLVSSEDVADGKPSPDGYRLAAQRLGVTPEACVVIEDAPPGIQAGRAASMAIVGVTTTYPAERLPADVIVRDLTGITATVADGALTLTIRSAVR